MAYAPFDYKSQELYDQFHLLFDVFIDRLELLCGGSTADSCRSSADNGTPYSFDKHHISLDFSEMSGRMYAREQNEMLSELLSDSLQKDD